MQIDLYPTITPESLTEDMVSRLRTNLQTNEGSYTRDLLAAVGVELFEIYKALNRLLPIAFVDETSGEYLETRCAEYGITRKPGTAARVELEFSGQDGAEIPAGTTVGTPGGLLFSTEQAGRIQQAAVKLPAVAQEVGAAYNVPPGTLTTLLTPVSGVRAVSNPEAAQGGSEEESDAALFSRLDQYRKNRAASGNVADYTGWALQVSGVGAAQVLPLWNGAGTVKVLLAGEDKKPVDTEIVAACARHIESVRPIGAAVTVESAGAFPVAVKAVLQLESGAVLERVKTEFQSQLEAYFRELALQKSTIPYNRVAFLLLSIAGVENFTELTLNQLDENLTIPAGSVPVLGEVDVT